MNGPAGADRVAETTAAWREGGDAEAATRCLANDVELISPLTAQFRFQGRDQVHDVLSAAFDVISDIRIHTVVGEGPTRAVFYKGRCGKQEFEEAQLLRFDSEGLITEVTLYIRPLPGLTAVMEAIGPRLLRGQGKSRLAVAIGAAAKPLAAMTRIGERRLIPLADPSRR